MKNQYDFTKPWFEMGAKSTWDQMIPTINPSKILEIGSYEGAATCYLINTLGVQREIEIHCIDTWAGGIEHQEGGTAEANMSDVESRFLLNTSIAIENSKNAINLTVHKGLSDYELSKLYLTGKKNYFDLIYIDGSHQAPDVLMDAVLALKLLKIGGVLIFDDYLWDEGLPGGVDPIRCPKIAIDAFTNIFCRKIQVLGAPLYQLYVKKIAN
jgi:predicted O-methyltransferase YrrM